MADVIINSYSRTFLQGGFNMAEQLELNMNSNASLVLQLTGNPWTDFGIVSFCEDLRGAAFLTADPVLTESDATLKIDASDRETVEFWFIEMLGSRWNQIYWLSRVGKMLGWSLTYDAEGFVVTDAKRPIADAQKSRIKELSPQTQVKGEMPVTQTRLNFIGMPADARKIKQQCETVVRNFVQNWVSPGGKKICLISARRSDKLEKVLQMVNPFSNKHHNVKVRGFFGNNSNFEVGAILHYVNLCTTLEPHIPFVYNPSAKPDPTTYLVLPEVADLSLLAEIYVRLRVNLKDISDSRELSTSTNLRGIRRASDPYSLAIVLFHNIFYKFTVEAESEDEGSWSLEPLPIGESNQMRQHLTRWVIIPFSRKQNIRFGNFRTVEVNDQLYDFIRPIPFGTGDKIRLVPDILSRIDFSVGGEYAIRHLSKAIAKSDTPLMKTAIFRFWKCSDAIKFSPQKGRRHPVRLLRYFIQHFLEVNAVLNDELRADLRALGNTIGSVFSSDVTLISKLYNVSSENAFRGFLNQALFRLYKVGRSGEVRDGLLHTEVQGESKSMTSVNRDRITRILDETNDDTWKTMAETLSTFTSLSAYNAKFFKPTNEGDKDDE